MPLSFLERFRTWYDYERDCNAKCIAMLRSVPEANRTQPAFTRALDKMAHLVAARHMWLFRLGIARDKPAGSFPGGTLDEIAARIPHVEQMWVDYLASLTETQLESEFTWQGLDGKWRRWRLVDLLTQVFGHHWYHRGQIAMLVKDAGGEPVNTDFIFWAKPTEIPPPEHFA